jgi:hypothetical protein
VKVETEPASEVVYLFIQTMESVQRKYYHDDEKYFIQKLTKIPVIGQLVRIFCRKI